MHCSHCSSLMAEVETQKEGRTEQSLFECPVCARTQLITRTLDQWKENVSLQTERMARRVLRHT
ncbi:MAG: hypothetical protein KZQ89_05245 [Candidatus Thiodiazotropha sp. (ex Lucinoma kastoroae)]|nr:hypothetical protein [Candidatus Thiodiazotropha sp. (ex Lucinoma kastoroae)]